MQLDDTRRLIASAQMAYDVVDWVAYHAAVKPNAFATRELPSGRTQSYVEMHDRVGKIAAALHARGIRSGDRVAFLMPNTSDIMDITFATWRLGGVVLALNFRLSAQELSFILTDIPQVECLFLHVADVFCYLRPDPAACTIFAVVWAPDAGTERDFWSRQLG
jgi:acyl-CoA synthetase (AMP-forming)/AMP-acid ligase II